MSPKKLFQMLIILGGMFWSMNARGDPSTDKFLLIVSNPLYQTGLVTAALSTYQQDLQIEGWATTLITVNRAADPTADYICPTEAALKTVIQTFYTQGYDGFVIIGSPSHLPTAWWKWKFGEPWSDPTDLYYADMDEWIAKEGDAYTSYDASGNFVGANFGPELFFGRISAGPISATVEEEAARVAFYLEKIHDYRVNNGNLTAEQRHRAFIFRDDDYSWKGEAGFEPEHEASKNVHLILDLTLTNHIRLGQLLEEGHRFGEIWTHSGSYFHVLREWQGDNLTYNNDFNLAYLNSIAAKVNYLNLFACSALRFTEANFGATYLFNTAKTCNVSGSSGGWGPGLDSLYFAKLNSGIPVGIAFQDLANRQIAIGEEGWPKGIFMGDPLLKHTMNVTNRPPRIVNELRWLVAFPNETFEQVFLTADPENDPAAISIEDLPPDMTLNGNRLSWTPGFQHQNSYRALTVKATDSHGNSFREEFTIYVYPGYVNVLANGGFESGSGGTPDSWFPGSSHPASVFEWEPAGSSYNGTRCVSITSENFPADARWIQQVSNLKVGAWYLLQGWVKGENIELHGFYDVGANLSFYGTWYRSAGLNGTFDWTPVRYKFPARPEFFEAAARLGYWSSEVTGKAWFDDVVLLELRSVPITPDLMLAANDVELTKPAYTEGNIHSNEEVEFKQGKPSTHQGGISAVEGVYIGKKMTVNGDVAAPEVKNYGAVNGNINLQAVAPLPLPAQPAYSPNTDDREIRGTVTLAPGHYGEITVRKNAVLNLNAGEYQLQHLEIHQNAAVNADVSGGAVNIYLRDELEFKGEGSFTALGASHPSELVTIWSGYSKTIKVRKNSILNGCNLYAPAAAVEFAGNSFFKGFVCAREIEVQKNAALVTHQSSLTPQGAFYLAAAGDEEEEAETAASAAAPETYELSQNFPNPFNAGTEIHYQLPEVAEVEIMIYNILGQKIRVLVNRRQEAGKYRLTWNGDSEQGQMLPSGIYFLRMRAGKFIADRKLLLLK